MTCTGDCSLSVLARCAAGSAAPVARATDRIAHRRHGHRRERRRPARRDGDGHRRRRPAQCARPSPTTRAATRSPTWRRGPTRSRVELNGFAPTRGDGHARRRRCASRSISRWRVAGVAEAVTVAGDATVLDTTSAKIGVNVSPEEIEKPAGQRPQLRQPDDAGDRRDHRRQRRLGERAVQRQVEPAELPELRRRRRHLRVGREPRLPQRHRLAVPAADVDGVDRGVPRQLRPGAGRERPRRRRQHHRRSARAAATASAARSSSTSATTRSTRPASTTTRSSSSSSTSSAARSAARSSRNKTFFFGSYEGLKQTTGLSFTEAVPSDEAHAPHPGRRAGRQRRRPERRRARRRSRRCSPGFPQGTVADGEPAAGAGHARHARPSRTRTRVSLRVDHRFTNNQSFYARYLYSDGEVDTPDRTVTPRRVLRHAAAA